jgi:hypothetical protein
MLVNIPAHQLVYTSDVVQRGPAGDWYAPEMLLELTQAFHREKIDPQKCFGMHYGLTNWSDMRSVLAAHLAPASP